MRPAQIDKVLLESKGYREHLYKSDTYPGLPRIK